MSLNNYLIDKGFKLINIEGNSEENQVQTDDLIKLISNPIRPLNVMEIGFNAGHSADIFLKHNPYVNLISFDNNYHNYVMTAKEYIDKTYPNRHTLILGDSRITVPEFIKNNNGTKFDIIFIDGSHDYNIVKQDIENCYKLAHKDTIVIMDDTMYIDYWRQNWNIGPTKIWTEYILSNKIIDVYKRDYEIGKGMSWGKYSFN